MEFLANENFPGVAVTALRKRGHDVKWIREDAPGSADIAVLELAQRENRILLTFDKDFGELAFRFGLPSGCGIILFRISMPSSEHIAQVATAVLDLPNPWIGHFSIIEDDRIRMKAFP